MVTTRVGAVNDVTLATSEPGEISRSHRAFASRRTPSQRRAASAATARTSIYESFERSALDADLYAGCSAFCRGDLEEDSRVCAVDAIAIGMWRRDEPRVMKSPRSCARHRDDGPPAYRTLHRRCDEAGTALRVIKDEPS